MQPHIHFSSCIIVLVSFCAMTSCIHINNDAFVINANTGVLYPPLIPVIVSPGDEILLCAPPGLSVACHDMVNETCFTLKNACVSKIIDETFSGGSTVYLETNAPTLYKNKVQPWSDPALHCIVLFGRNGDLFSDCVKAFSRYENVTDTSLEIGIGSGYKSLTLTSIFQVSSSYQLKEQRRLLCFIFQIVVVLLTVPLLVLRSKMHTN